MKQTKQNTKNINVGPITTLRKSIRSRDKKTQLKKPH
jgi:hypothetical protein